VARDGTAYVAWNEIKSTSRSRILLARSTDGGRSWSPSKTVASLPTQAFVPALAIARNGTLGVSWDDFRNDRAGDKKLITDVFFAHSHDRGETWTEAHLAGSFDTLTAPPTGSTGIQGRFLGDYQALVPIGNDFGAIFAQARPKASAGPSDVFFGRLARHAAGPGPPRPPTAGTLQLTVRPRTTASRRRTTFRFRVRRGRGARARSVGGARIRFAGRTATTTADGKATISRRLGRPGRVCARATAAGFEPGTACVVVRGAGCRPRARICQEGQSNRSQGRSLGGRR